MKKPNAGTVPVSAWTPMSMGFENVPHFRGDWVLSMGFENWTEMGSEKLTLLGLEAGISEGF